MAKGTTRRSQSVVPFGIGSIVEFEDDALMPAGLDMWPPNRSGSSTIDSPRGLASITSACLPLRRSSNDAETARRSPTCGSRSGTSVLAVAT